RPRRTTTRAARLGVPATPAVPRRHRDARRPAAPLKRRPPRGATETHAARGVTETHAAPRRHRNAHRPAASLKRRPPRGATETNAAPRRPNRRRFLEPSVPQTAPAVNAGRDAFTASENSLDKTIRPLVYWCHYQTALEMTVSEGGRRWPLTDWTATRNGRRRGPRCGRAPTTPSRFWAAPRRTASTSPRPSPPLPCAWATACGWPTSGWTAVPPAGCGSARRRCTAAATAST